MRYRHAMVLAILVGTACIGLAAASPPADTPAGNVAGDRGPPFAQDQPLWQIVLLTSIIVLTVLAAVYVLYHRFFAEEDGEPVVVQTDEERVMAMFDGAEGDIKQKQVREQTGWSAAKVSRVTGRLEEDGRIQKLRIGRENVIRRTE